MSMKGQNTKSIRKKSLPNTRLPVVGTKAILFFHEAIQGEQYIDLTSLVIPSGHQNPSPTELLKARLKDFEENFELTSSSKGKLMKPLSYEVVTNSTIKLKFEADEGEIFEGKLSNYTVNGTVIADVRTPNASGTLLEDQTDFNLGEAIPMKEFSSQWPIQVFRGPNGTPMLRNANNAAYTGDDSIGNYQMIDRGDGYCQVIRFNIAGDIGGEPVFWANHGALGERPDLSVLQRVDKIHGIMDKMREDLYVLTGNDVEDPTRYDEGVPTQADIKAFGDIVGKLNSLYNTTQKLSEYTKTAWQKKTLLVQQNVNGAIAVLGFNNLVIGKTYRLSTQTHHYVSANITSTLIYTNGAEQLIYSELDPETAAAQRDTRGASRVFTATATTIIATATVAGGSAIEPNQTWAILEELPNHETTTQWT